MTDDDLVAAVTLERDDYVPRALELANDELKRRGVDVPARSAEVAVAHARRASRGQKKLGTRWLEIHARLLLVSAVAMPVLHLLTPDAALPLELTLALSVIRGFAGVGLVQRRRWGYYFNFVALFSTFIAGLARPSAATAIAWLAWMLVNAVYFVRRQHLFTAGPKRAEMVPFFTVVEERPNESDEPDHPEPIEPDPALEAPTSPTTPSSPEGEPRRRRRS